jgi:hypothetical protein
MFSVKLPLPEPSKDMAVSMPIAQRRTQTDVHILPITRLLPEAETAS